MEGGPLLDIWLDAWDGAGVGEILVNLHHMPGGVRDHLAERSGPPAVRTVFEPELRGSAGTLRANRDWVAGEEIFLACNADNLTDFDLRELVDAHRTHRLPATLAVFHSPNPSAGGAAGLDAVRTEAGFTEKPPAPATDLVNAGIYPLRPAVLCEIDSPLPRDLRQHL